MTLEEIVAFNIKGYRKRLGMTQTELAEKSGLKQNQVSLAENRGKSPSLRTLEKLAKALSVSVIDLLSPSEGDS